MVCISSSKRNIGQYEGEEDAKRTFIRIQQICDLISFLGASILNKTQINF